MNSTIELRSINRLLLDEKGSPARYWIPAYQRGYRWEKRQVMQLLDDIWDFIQTSGGKDNSAFYCLQPLVVRKLSDGRYEVVDGQQRLTTLFILLSHQRKIVEIVEKEKFEIDFETRDPTFLRDIDLDRFEENADFYHICEAWREIDSWTKTHDSSHVLKLIQHLLNDDEAGKNVKVIWYEIDSDSDPVAAFTRLNVGKIPLTESELIRALFLRRAAQDDATGNLSLRIAYEWDQIEKRLQSDEVWYFLQNNNLATNRIGLIFRLAAHMAGKKIDDTEYGVFAHFAESLNLPQSAEKQWQEVKETFMALEEWYDDRELFHVLGFILHETNDSLDAIKKLLNESRQSSKKAFSKSIRNQVRADMLNEGTTSHENVEEEVLHLCENTHYGSAQVKRLLLLFNLASLLEDPRSNTRFQFDSYKLESWDIEHIRSVSDSRPSRPNEQRVWLSHCLAYLKASTHKEELKLSRKIASYLESEPGSDGSFEFEEIDGEILRVFEENNEGPEHNLSNLTLLDSRTNRGYKNAVFAVKRNILLQHDKTGIFVPICTRNAFLKCYSKQIRQAVTWSKEDGRDYLDEIIKTLTRFFLLTETTPE